MPPSSPSSNTPQPPAPKQSFWAKLFGKKPKEQPTQPQDTQTPPPPPNDPQLDNLPPDVTASSNGMDLPRTDETATPNSEGEQLPPTLDVPPSVEAKPLDANEDKPPTLPTQPAYPEDDQQAPGTFGAPPEAPPETNQPDQDQNKQV